jgi:general secretion pathway protein B
MSYILEALKKAQAERQLGNAPTIHAPQTMQPAQPDTAASRKPLFIGMGAGVLVLALGGLFMWQRTPAPLVAAPSAPPAAPAAVRSPLAPSIAAGAAPDTLEVSAPPAPSPAPAPRPAHVAEAPAVPPAPPARPRAAAASVPAPAPSPEDSLPYLHQLPDTMQRELPRVSFGGYMYSANPADRLLLVDKSLRHEGEEVAPGLVLEKLLPKAAVMSYRGVRYRVAY